MKSGTVRPDADGSPPRNRVSPKTVTPGRGTDAWDPRLGSRKTVAAGMGSLGLEGLLKPGSGRAEVGVGVGVGLRVVVAGIGAGVAVPVAVPLGASVGSSEDCSEGSSAGSLSRCSATARERNTCGCLGGDSSSGTGEVVGEVVGDGST